MADGRNKSWLRAAYRRLPFKRPALLALRAAGFTRLIPARLRRYLAFQGPFSVTTTAGTFLMVNGYGFEIESGLFWEGERSFEPATTRMWMTLAADAQFIFDVGANTGVFALLAQSVNPTATVHAFEPIARVHAVLAENCRINSARAGFGITCHRVALSDYSGEGLMHDLPVEHMYTASLNNIHKGRGQTMQGITEAVPVMRFDDFLERHAIGGLDLVKIDVESHEPSVLRGFGSLIDRYHPTLLVEIWNNEVGTAAEAILASCGYLYYALLDDQGPTLVQHIKNDHPDRGYINYLVCTHAVAERLRLRTSA